MQRAQNVNEGQSSVVIYSAGSKACTCVDRIIVGGGGGGGGGRRIPLPPPESAPAYVAKDQPHWRQYYRNPLNWIKHLFSFVQSTFLNKQIKAVVV